MNAARAAPGLALGALLLASCGGPSMADRMAEPAATSAALADCKGCPTDAELRKAAGTDEQFEFVRRVNALETRLTGRPLAPGNRVELLRDGPSTHAAQIEAIRKARHHVHLITYILSDDPVSHAYRDAMAERAKAGVKVRFMFDGMGGRTISEEFRSSLTRAGIEVNEFGPLNPTGKEDMSMSRRHHRKILVVDGKVAFTGGINITDEKRASSGGGSKAAGWRDTHVRIEGPAVAQFQRLFIDSWEHGERRFPDAKEYWPKLAPAGDSLVRAIQQQGNDIVDFVTEAGVQPSKDDPEHAIYASYLVAIRNARQRVWITQAYFIPNAEFLEILEAAARRGVDVRLLVPGTSDIAMMLHASRHYYAPLLDAGARIWEYGAPVMHAKTAVVDGVWSTVGSSNIDFRSFIHNDEANAIVIGRSFGAQMEQMFQEDLKRAQEITPERWAKRGWGSRMRERMSVMFKYWI